MKEREGGDRTEGEGSRRGAGRSPRRRRILFGLAAAGGMFVVLVGLIEAGLWVFAPVPYHEFLEYEPEGHISGRAVPNQVIHTRHGSELRINKHGFRGPDWAWRKQPGTLRIEVFGGSSVFCYESNGEENTWPGALQARLRERLRMPVEVINLSIPGFNSFHSKINYLCWGRAFKPDAAIIYNTWNCMRTLRDLERVPYVKRGVASGGKPFWKHIARATQIGRRGRDVWFHLHGEANDLAALDVTGSGKDLDRPVTEFSFAWERQNFLDFVNFVREDGALPILSTQAGLASLENLKDEEIRRHFSTGAVNRGYTLELAVKTWMRVSEIIKDVARENDVPVVDGYNAVPHDLKHVMDNVHMTDEGHEVLAEEFARVLSADQRFMAVVERVRAEPMNPTSGPAEKWPAYE